MGQAKRRGTLEERVAKAKEKNKANQEEQDRLDDLAYVERQKRNPARSNIIPFMLISAAMMASARGSNRLGRRF